jgi:hypothetical protein
MQTIKRGASGVDVKRWQGIIGVTADGVFGPATESATKAWQVTHKLAPDGVVGPVSWSTALGTITPKVVAKTPQAGIDGNAYEIAKRAAPQLTEKERQYVITVARGEGFYGLGWGHPNAATIAESQKYGLTGYEGQGSNNWGADQGSGSAGSFPHVDYHADGSSYVGHYAKQNTPEEGFNRMAKIILGGGKKGSAGAAKIKAAIDKGSLRDAVFAQHENGYFELAPEKYLSAVLKNYDILTVNTGWKRSLSEKGGLIGRLLGAIGIGVVLVIGGVLVAKARA